MTNGRKSFLFFLLLGLAIVCGVSANGQTVQGVIAGTVTDPSGAVVPKAIITITNTGTGISQTATTGTDGTYRFSLVPPGTYTIGVKAAAFAEEKASGIIVQASQTVSFDLKLQVAQTSQIIEITGQTQLVQTATSDLSLQIDRSTIQNAALVDRNVFTLAFLAPQVSPGMDLTPASGGARESGTSYLMNGVDDNDNFGEGSANIIPPLESIQDFSVLTNNMSAQYGRGIGAVISANQRSGTNKFHGVLYEFNRNASLNANDYFYNRDLSSEKSLPADQRTLSPRPKYIKNQFGGAVDGPIFREKTFFSFAYDRMNLLSGTTSANNFVPTSSALAFVKANGGPLAQAVLTARPPVTSDLTCPNQPGTGAGTAVGCLSFFDPINDTIDTYYGRVDHNFGPNDRISVIANISRELYEDKYGGAPLTTNGAIPSITTNHFHNIAILETHTFSPSLLNEMNISHNRHYNVSQEGNGIKDTVPNILIDNQNEGSLSYQLGGDYEGGQLSNFTQDRWGVQDNLAWTAGRHSFKFGGGGQYGILYRNWDL